MDSHEVQEHKHLEHLDRIHHALEEVHGKSPHSAQEAVTPASPTEFVTPIHERDINNVLKPLEQTGATVHEGPDTNPADMTTIDIIEKTLPTAQHGSRGIWNVLNYPIKAIMGERDNSAWLHLKNKNREERGKPQFELVQKKEAA